MQDVPFSLAQVDTKDILDKGTLGTRLWTYMWRRRLPRYQWTYLEGKTRLRFLAYSRELSLTNGLCFMFLVMLWLRKYGVKEEIIWQTDWGEEYGKGMEGKTPFEKLKEMGYDLPEEFAVFPPIILDTISAD